MLTIQLFMAGYQFILAYANRNEIIEIIQIAQPQFGWVSSAYFLFGAPFMFCSRKVGTEWL